MIITTNDIKVKDQAPEKLIILTTDENEPKEFVIKGKRKPKSEQIITTGNVKDKKHALTPDQEKTVADIRKEQARVKVEQKKSIKLEADLKKANAKLKAMEKSKKKAKGYKPPPEDNRRPKKPTPPPPEKKK